VDLFCELYVDAPPAAVLMLASPVLLLRLSLLLVGVFLIMLHSRWLLGRFTGWISDPTTGVIVRAPVPNREPSRRTALACAAMVRRAPPPTTAAWRGTRRQAGLRDLVNEAVLCRV
jgi:hypothetical protein